MIGKRKEILSTIDNLQIEKQIKELKKPINF